MTRLQNQPSLYPLPLERERRQTAVNRHGDSRMPKIVRVMLPAGKRLQRARSGMRIRRRLDSRCKVNRVRESLIAEKEVT